MSDLLRNAAREACTALAPFAGCETNDDGEPRRDDEWPPHTERIKDWFSWEDFRAAIRAFDHLREALAVEPEYEYHVVGEWQETTTHAAFKGTYYSAVTIETALGRIPEVRSEFPDADVYVERRVRAGEWERVS